MSLLKCHDRISSDIKGRSGRRKLLAFWYLFLDTFDTNKLKKMLKETLNHAKDSQFKSQIYMKKKHEKGLTFNKRF